MHANAETADGLGVGGAIVIRTWDVRDLLDARPDWEHLARDVRHAILTDPERRPVEADSVGVTRNLVTDAYLEALARGVAIDPTHLALGDDASTAPAGDNQTLNNEIYRVQVGQDETDGKDRLTSTYISQNEANGEAIREVGFADGERSGRWTLLSHALLDSADQIDEKTSNMTVTIDYVLQYRRA